MGKAGIKRQLEPALAICKYADIYYNQTPLAANKRALRVRRMRRSHTHKTVLLNRCISFQVEGYCHIILVEAGIKASDID